eukprot:TRINITY_DN44427_c0_g1_i1.p1 TRINITY_DN44427_c0_g1~~TRINITY_DN44427_c0_g1_i1.p1  ORF type:complete len:194 (-),score=-14.10 TRINITY_DN44427_c0_g1_i1:145-726(-)
MRNVNIFCNAGTTYTINKQKIQINVQKFKLHRYVLEFLSSNSDSKWQMKVLWSSNLSNAVKQYLFTGIQSLQLLKLSHIQPTYKTYKKNHYPQMQYCILVKKQDLYIQEESAKNSVKQNIIRRPLICKTTYQLKNQQDQKTKELFWGYILIQMKKVQKINKLVHNLYVQTTNSIRNKICSKCTSRQTSLLKKI